MKLGHILVSAFPRVWRHVEVCALAAAVATGAWASAGERADLPGPVLTTPTDDEPALSEQIEPLELTLTEQPEPVGEPLAAGMVELLQNEIVDGLRRRGIQGNFARFAAYAGSRLDATSGPRTGLELTGKCRLKWYDHLLRNPLGAGRGRRVHPAVAHGGPE